MKSKLKLVSVCMTALSALLFLTPGYSTTLIEFILSGQAEPYTVTAHNQCNQTPVNKSLLNNKSLNPLCQVCISLQDSLGLSSVYYSIPDSALSGNSSSTASYSLCGISDAGKTLGDAFVADFSLLCSTRGGTVSGTGSDTAVTCSIAPAQ